MCARVKGKHGKKVDVPSPITEFLGAEGVGDSLEAEHADLVRKVGVEAGNEARRIDVEAARDDLSSSADALVGASRSGPIVAAREAAVGSRDSVGEEEGLLEVSLDGSGAGVLLHALVAGAAVAEEDGHLATLVATPGFAGGGRRGVIGVGGGGGGGHLELLGRVGRRGGH